MSLDCQACGACCLGRGPEHVGCTVEDMSRLPPAYVARVVVAATFRALAVVPGPEGLRCCALAGDVGKRVACAVYHSRPDVCRALTPGDAACMGARAAAGIIEVAP